MFCKVLKRPRIARRQSCYLRELDLVGEQKAYRLEVLPATVHVVAKKPKHKLLLTMNERSSSYR